jgi:hypothetical protein
VDDKVDLPNTKPGEHACEVVRLARLVETVDGLWGQAQTA